MHAARNEHQTFDKRYTEISVDEKTNSLPYDAFEKLDNV